MEIRFVIFKPLSGCAAFRLMAAIPLLFVVAFIIIELRNEFFQQCGMCDQQSLRSACAYAQSDPSLCLSLEYSMTFKLLTEHYFELLSLKGGCTCSSESTLDKMPHCWKAHVVAQYVDFCVLLWVLW